MLGNVGVAGLEDIISTEGISPPLIGQVHGTISLGCGNGIYPLFGGSSNAEAFVQGGSGIRHCAVSR